MRDQAPPREERGLADRVYAELKRRLDSGRLKPGSFVDLAELGSELGMSRTPLRDAMLRLELEGFVDIYPRRGVRVRPLELSDIRDIYEIVGALEAQAALSARRLFRPSHAERLEALDLRMREALDADDFPSYYQANLAFHEVWLGLSDNTDLVAAVRVRKERLYDFPRKSAYVREWELASVEEHREIARRFRAGDFRGAADYLRDVHWSFEVQEDYVRAYYLAPGGREA